MRFFLVSLVATTSWGIGCHAFLRVQQQQRRIGRNKGACELALAFRGKDKEEVFNNHSANSQRRRLLQSFITAMAISGYTTPAYAGGLVQFPPTKPFLNTYHLMRVGETMLEADDIWSTNPLFLTNREDALTPRGQEQVIAAANQLRTANMAPTILKYSLAAACIDTSNLIGRQLNIGRDRLVPEFTFQDPRAIGAWDMLSKSEVTPAVWAMDDMEAGVMGTNARPPPNEDGTPHETLADQMTRLRQLVSVLESQYSGDTILLIFPDGTGPAVLSAMLAGIPFNRVHELEFAPGELRTNVTPESVRALWKAKLEDSVVQEEYQQYLAQGRDKLKELRSTQTFVSRKDERLERERLEIDALYEQKQQQDRRQEQEKLLARQELRKQEALARQRQVEEKQRQASYSIDDDGVPMGAISSATLIAVAGATLMGGKNEDTKTLTKVAFGRNATQAVDEAPVTSLSNGHNTNETLTTVVEGAGPQSSPPTAALSSYFGSSNSTSNSEHNGNMLPTHQNSTTSVAVKQRVNGSSQSTFVETMVDARTAAQNAMEEYLDQDDGGAAWLMSLSEIMDDADELMEESEEKQSD